LSEPIIRAVSDADSNGLITLIGNAFSEYPSVYLDVDGEMPELRHPASAIHSDGGRWWVAELEGAIVGSAAFSPVSSDEAELKRLYVAAATRRRGLGERLCRLVEREAFNREVRKLFLWTDTRFSAAHRLYERLGYTRAPDTRALNDVSNTIEYHYTKELGR
jgi:N-acetylglutamate synthase-like GNAT family acetyltransferase